MKTTAFVPDIHCWTRTTNICFSLNHFCIEVPLQKVFLTERYTPFLVIFHRHADGLIQILTRPRKLKYMYVAAVCLGCQFCA